MGLHPTHSSSADDETSSVCDDLCVVERSDTFCGRRGALRPSDVDVLERVGAGVVANVDDGSGQLAGVGSAWASMYSEDRRKQMI